MSSRSDIDFNSEPGPAAPSSGELESQALARDPSGPARCEGRSEWHLGDDPHLVSFKFAFTVGMVVLAGITMMIWGITILSARIFLLGTFFTLAGGLLYGRSLSVEE